jgi:tetratricopeptide (TPR) repeat protein
MTDLMFHLRPAPLLAMVLLCGSGARAQLPGDQAVAAQARALVAADDPKAALDLVAEKERAGQPPGFDLLFAQGVAWQTLAARAAPAERAGAIDQAQSAYRSALARQPTSPAVFNNLGALADAAGDDDGARQWYGRAVEAGASRRGFYALNYARYLEPRDLSSAETYARLALESAPQSTQARELLARLLARPGSGTALLRLLDQSTREGHTGFVVQTALRELATPTAPRPEGERASLLALVAGALASDRAALADEPPAELLAGLRALAGDATLGTGARQLAAVLRTAPGSPNELGWWGFDRLVPFELTRRAVMRGLLRGLGEQRAGQDPKAAGQWLQLAIEMGDQGPDPEVFLRLVEHAVNHGQPGRVRELMDRYQWELFSEKSMAYAKGDWAQIYRLHLALGMTYAHLGVWTSSQSPYQNAVFQLENAGRAAERFNQRLPPQNPSQRLVVPAAAALQLARGYTALGDARKSTDYKIRAAGALLDAQRPADSAQVLGTIQKPELKRLEASREVEFQRLTNRIGTL